MAFPQIRACLIAEDAREERYRKLTILGFYGITPDVEILVKDITKPIESITFILLGSSAGGGKYQIRPRLLSELREELVRATPSEIEIPSPPTPSGHINLIIHFASPIFPREGLYKFILEVDGQQHYETTFGVRLGQPQEFQ